MSPKSSSITLEILQYSYWEHFKMAKDLSLILPVDHPKRKEVEKSMTDLLEKIDKQINKI